MLQESFFLPASPRRKAKPSSERLGKGICDSWGHSAHPQPRLVTAFALWEQAAEGQHPWTHDGSHGTPSSRPGYAAHLPTTPQLPTGTYPSRHPAGWAGAGSCGDPRYAASSPPARRWSRGTACRCSALACAPTRCGCWRSGLQHRGGAGSNALTRQRLGTGHNSCSPQGPTARTGMRSRNCRWVSNGPQPWPPAMQGAA